MITIVSAMRAGDVDWWLSLWDIKARDEQESLLRQKPGKASSMITGWKGLFGKTRVELVRTLTYGDYVIISYQLVTPDTGQTSWELPSVFRREGGAWRATNDLRSDPLPRVEPWVSGKTEEEEVVR